MTSEELNKLEALCEKATPGPWRTGNASADDFWHGKGSILHDEKVLFVGNVNFDLAADAAFIAAAREAVPKLIAEVRTLSAEFIAQSWYHHSFGRAFGEPPKE